VGHGEDPYEDEEEIVITIDEKLTKDEKKRKKKLEKELDALEHQ
jgi:hypothetical protein